MLGAAPGTGYRVGATATHWFRMKLPESIRSVTLCVETFDAPYPPLGFHPIDELQLGNGDKFGLYWPIGREEQEPIVAETYHDEWSLQPKFSSLERFLAAETEDEDSHIDTPSYEEDPDSPLACLHRARSEINADNVDGAIQKLKRAVTILPEYTEAHTLLWTQHRRVGDRAAAIASAVQAIISPPCFGPRPMQAASWLSRQSSCPPEFEDDPIWLSRARFTLRFGGIYENEQYAILRAAIDRYLERSALVRAMTLMQTYAQLMYLETKPFQERNGFRAEAYVTWQRDVAASRHGHARELSAQGTG